jgi:hypothetical protein
MAGTVLTDVPPGTPPISTGFVPQPALPPVAPAPVSAGRPLPGAPVPEESSSTIPDSIAATSGQPGMDSDPADPQTTAALNAIEDHGDSVQQQIADAVASAMGKLGKSKKETPIDATAIVKRMTDMRYLMENPAKMAERLNENLLPLDEHAPEMAQQVRHQTMQAVQTIVQSMPPPTNQPNPFSSEEYVPTYDPAALRAHEQIVQAVQDPLGVISEGPTRAQMGAIRAVYPKIASETAMAMMTALGSGKHTYQQRLQALSLMGIDQDPTFAMQLAAIGAAPQPSIGHNLPEGRPSKSGMTRMKTPRQSMTPSQAANAREVERS